MAEHPAREFPGDLAKSPKPLKFKPVEEKLRLSDDTLTIDVLWARNNIHMADCVFAYAPAQKVMMEGDIATAAYDYQFWPDNFRDPIEYYKLDAEKLSPVHAISREHPNYFDDDANRGTDQGRDAARTGTLCR